MLNIIAFLLIIIFVPAVTGIAIKLYSLNKDKLILIFVWVLFGLELIRFFYNASFYESAITPSDSLTLTYLSIMCVLSLFALYNKGKVGKLFKNIFVFSALTPLIMGLFDSSLYVRELDTYSVLAALYFVETAIVITVALLFVLGIKEKLTAKQMLPTLSSLALYVGLNALARFCFQSGDFTLMWGLSMITILIGSAVVFAVIMLVLKNKIANNEVPSANEPIAETITEQPNEGRD